MDRLQITPTTTPDPAKPVEVSSMTVHTDTGGRPQVKMTVQPAEGADPGDPKPEPKADEKKPEAPARPSWLPEKFTQPQDLKDAAVALAEKMGKPAYVIRGIKASESGQEVSDFYSGLEREQSAASQKPTPQDQPKAEEKKAEEKPEEKKEDAPAPVAKSAAEKAEEVAIYGEWVASMLEKAGVSAKQFGEEYTKAGGKISEEKYVAFEKAGVTRDFLTNYMKTVTSEAQVMAQATINEIKGSVGGEEAFGKMALWASSNLTPDQHEEYTAMVNSGNVKLAKKAVSNLKEWYTAANPPAPNLVKDTTAPRGGDAGDQYGSWDEVKADMRDARYKAGDPAFHRKVNDKLNRSKNL